MADGVSPAVLSARTRKICGSVPRVTTMRFPFNSLTLLIDLKRLVHTIHATRMDAGILIATALTGLAFGLDQAILIGVALSILLFVPRAAKLKATELVVDGGDVVRGRYPADPPNAGLRRRSDARL